jgi:hypothetical protein
LNDFTRRYLVGNGIGQEFDDIRHLCVSWFMSGKSKKRRRREKKPFAVGHSPLARWTIASGDWHLASGSVYLNFGAVL